MAAAMAVRTGIADVTLGLRAAQVELGLGFVPVARERFDLVIPQDLADLPAIQRLLEVIRSAAFAEVLTGLPGYDPVETGRVLELDAE